MNCPRCNSFVEAGSSFCSNCGFNLGVQNNNMNQNNMVNNQQMMNNQQMINNQQMMNNQQMNPNNFQMQQGFNNQYQQNGVQKKKLSKAMITIIVIDCIALPLFILQASGDSLNVGSLITVLAANACIIANDMQKNKNNINK